MPLDAAGAKQLKTRLVIAPALLATIAGVYLLDIYVTRGRASAAVIGMLAIAALYEYVHMMRGAGFPIGQRFLIGAGVLLHVAALAPASLTTLSFATLSSGTLSSGTGDPIDAGLYPPVLLAVALVFALSVRALSRTRVERGLEEVGSTLLGFVLIAWPLYFGQGLALHSLHTLFFVVLVAKSGDIGGYFAGISFGRRKLIPWVSPGKSVEGAAGSLVLSCVVACLLRGLLPAGMAASVTVALLLGVMINVTTQLGDLVESLLKRRCGVKDSSRMLPVHGGVLDLVDSLLFSLPAMFFVLVVTGP